jgi:hypothetical protein
MVRIAVERAALEATRIDSAECYTDELHCHIDPDQVRAIHRSRLGLQCSNQLVEAFPIDNANDVTTVESDQATACQAGAGAAHGFE